MNKNTTAPQPTAPWYEDHAEVVAFARVLVESDVLPASDLLDYLEKPWKWTPEHDEHAGGRR